ncbi:MAG: DUF4286 family protein [Bacteroidia bacterium]
MIIYSVTVSIDAELRSDWLQWMEKIHIPDVMRTGCFEAYALQEVVDPPPQEGTFTFNVQYHCANMETYERYREQHAAALQADHNRRYENRFAAFRTLLHRMLEA